MNKSTLLGSSKELFQKLLNDYDEFFNDPLSKYKALNCASVAWHLTDWVYNEYEKSNFSSLGDMRNEFYKSCGDLKVMHDLTTGLKHFTISSPKSSMSGSHLHEGVYSDEYSSEYDVSSLMIEYTDKDPEPIDLLFEKVVNFWKDYFNKQDV